MLQKFAIVAAAAAGIGYVTLSSEGPQACDVDGDGRFHIQQSDGTLKQGRGWTLTADGRHCFASPDVLLPRRDLVNYAGQPLPKP